MLLGQCVDGHTCCGRAFDCSDQWRPLFRDSVWSVLPQMHYNVYWHNWFESDCIGNLCGLCWAFFLYWGWFCVASLSTRLWKTGSNFCAPTPCKYWWNVTYFIPIHSVTIPILQETAVLRFVSLALPHFKKAMCHHYCLWMECGLVTSHSCWVSSHCLNVFWLLIFSPHHVHCEIVPNEEECLILALWWFSQWCTRKHVDLFDSIQTTLCKWLTHILCLPHLWFLLPLSVLLLSVYEICLREWCPAFYALTGIMSTTCCHGWKYTIPLPRCHHFHWMPRQTPTWQGFSWNFCTCQTFQWLECLGLQRWWLCSWLHILWWWCSFFHSLLPCSFLPSTLNDHDLKLGSVFDRQPDTTVSGLFL